MIIASCANGLACFLCGPSSLLRFPDSLVLIGIGLGLVGIMLGNQFIPGLPEMVESSYRRFL